MPKRAQPYWDDVLARLDSLGILSEVDGEAIARYADCLARYGEVAEKLAGEEDCLVDANGRVYLSPRIKIANDLLTNLRHFEQRLGLTPADRSRITLPSAEDEQKKSATGKLFKTG